MPRGRRKSVQSEEKRENYPVYNKAIIDDNEIASFIEKEYNARKVQKIGVGRSMDFWAAIGEWKEEPRLLLLTVNPHTGYVGGIFTLPCEVMKGLAKFINKVRKGK